MVFAVASPWYSSTRYLAAALTFNYGYQPLVGGTYDQQGNFSQTKVIIAHQMLMHLDVAGSFLDRVQLSATLPVTLSSKERPASV